MPVTSTFVPPRPEELDPIATSGTPVSAPFVPPRPEELDPVATAAPMQPPAAPVAPIPFSALNPQAVDAQTTQHAQTLARAIAGPTISAQPAPGFFDRLAAPFTGPGSAYGNMEEQRTGGQASYNPDAPLIDFGANRNLDTEGPIAKALTTHVLDALSGFTTLKSIGILLATGGFGAEGQAAKALDASSPKVVAAGARYFPKIKALVSQGFGLDMLWSALKASPQLVDQVKHGDIPGAVGTLTDMGISAGMGVMATRHAIGEWKGNTPHTAPADEAQRATGLKVRGQSPYFFGPDKGGRPVISAKPASKPEASGPQYNSAGQPVYQPPAQPPQPPAAPISQPGPAAAPAAPVAAPTATASPAPEPLPAPKAEAAPAVTFAPPPPETLEATPAQPPAAPVAPARGPNLSAKLPAPLAGAKPRFGYGKKLFLLSFDSDVDRAAYITAQPKPSKSDAAYLKFAMHATGAPEEDVRAHGAAVRAAIKAQAKDAESGATLTVPDMARKRFGKPAQDEQRPVAPVAAAPPAAAVGDNGGNPDDTGRTGAGGEEGRPGVSDAHARVRGPDTSPGRSGRKDRAQTSVLIAGDQDAADHPATYRLRELADLRASHHPFSFQLEPEYPYTNDRDYTQLEGQHRVISQAKKFNPRWLINTNPDATNGPPVVDRDGNAIGGNSRVMTLHRVFSLHPEAEAAYRAALAEYLSHYGIEPAELANMKDPILVREIAPENAEAVQRAITDMNKVGAAKLGPSEQAFADSRRVSADTLEAIQHYVAKLGETGNLAKVLGSPDGPAIVDRLVADGIITERERPQYLARDRVTVEGKTRIGRLMIGRFFPDVATYDDTPQGILNKLERVAAPLVHIEQRPEWDTMTAAIREALSLMRAAAARKLGKFEDLDAQSGMFGDGRKYSEAAYRWAYILEKNSVAALGRAFRAYAGFESLSRPGEIPDMFAPPPIPQAEAYALTIGTLKNAARKIDLAKPEPPPAPPAQPIAASPAPAIKPGVFERLSAAGKESDQWLRDHGIAGGTSSSANRILDPEVLFHMTRAIAGDVARGAIGVRVAAEDILDRLRGKFDGLPSLDDVAEQVRARIRESLPAGPNGPIAEYLRSRPREAVQWLLDNETGEVPGALSNADPRVGAIDLMWGKAGDALRKFKGGFGLAHILAKHDEMRAQILNLGDIVTGLRVVGEQREGQELALEDERYRAIVSKVWQPKGTHTPAEKTWLLTAFEPKGKLSPAADTLDAGSALRKQEGGASVPPGDQLSSSVSPAPRAPAGPTYMGSGFGALEPLFRESKAEGDRLRLARDEALAAAKAAEAKPEQMKAGERVRAYLTSERDLWAARTNQAIEAITRMLPKMQDREALGIAREFRHHPLELQAFIDGSHPFLSQVDGGPAVAEKNLAKLMPVLRQAQHILASPTARERSADAAFTTIAERDLQEGRNGGWLESRWRSDEYLPHALNPKGEGEVAKLPSTTGRAMGKVGKWFGFGERRSDRYPTLVHAVADGVIPKTLDPSALFTIHADQFARARATHLLEEHLASTGLGRWGDAGGMPEGWVQLAAHTDEFRKRFVATVPDSYDPEAGESEHRVGTMGLYVPAFIEKALSPITDPDYTAKIPGFAKLRTAQRGLKEAILGFSGFHLLTENFMAAADVGPTGMWRAFREPILDPASRANELDLIASGGTTSIQGSVMSAYRTLRPGTIPTRAEIVRAYIPGSKQALAVADAVTRFTFDNVQRRFKIWSFALHRDAWNRDNPNATPDQFAEAKKGIASYVNGVYGGLHWENMGVSRAMVEVSRAVFLAPDWSGSNLALAKYAVDARPSAQEVPFRRRLAGATSKESAQARLSRAFWTKQLIGGLLATQFLSLMFSGKLSKRPFQVYEGKDKDGHDVYQNVAFRGSIGDSVTLGTRVEEHAREGYEHDGPAGVFAGILVGAGVFVAGKAAPVAKLALHVLTGRNDIGRPETPGGLASDVLPVPIVAKTIGEEMAADDSDKYLWSERMLSLFGPRGQHVRGPSKRAMREELEQSIRAGAGISASVIESGSFSRADIAEALRDARLTPAQKKMEHAGIDEALKLYSKASAADKLQLQVMLNRKAANAVRTAAPADRAALLGRVRDALAAR